jgi:predicted S18 family serine protease
LYLYYSSCDGTIGEIGALPYKTLAAAKKGATVFLVPEGQANLTIIAPKEESPFPGVTIVTYEETQINLQQFLAQQGYAVNVVEVKTIMDAYNRLVEQ